MKRTLIVIVMMITVLTSCRMGAADITDEEARQILGDLIPIAEELNEIFLGSGLEPSEYTVEFTTAAKYVEVSPDAKYQTMAALKAAARAVFSEEYCEILFESAFDGSDDFTARYSESANGILQIDVNNYGYDLRTKLYPEQAAAKNKYDGKTAVSIPAEFDGVPCEDIIVYLVKENGNWLIDSPTY